MEPLVITLADQGGARVLLITGEIDLATSTDLAAALTGALAPASTVVLDMTAVSFMDAQGLRVLLAAHQGLATLGARLLLVPSPAVSRVMEVTGTTRFLNVDHGRGGALTARSPHPDTPASSDMGRRRPRT